MDIKMYISEGSLKTFPTYQKLYSFKYLLFFYHSICFYRHVKIGNISDYGRIMHSI